MRSELIKDIRRYKGMTQDQFSLWLGVHYSTISLTEANHRNVSDSLASKIALKFDVSNPDFIEYQERLRKAQEYFNTSVGN